MLTSVFSITLQNYYDSSNFHTDNLTGRVALTALRLVCFTLKTVLKKNLNAVFFVDDVVSR